MLFIAGLVSLLGMIAYHFFQKDYAPGEPNGGTLGSGSMFDLIAPYYDSANKFMSLGFDQSWRQSLVENLDVKVDDIILDVSTGTGDVAIWIAKKLISIGVTNGQPVTGFDPSSKMLSYAAVKIAKGNLDNMIQLVQGDAQNMDTLRSDYYSKVTMSFGIRNVPDRVKALHEIFRVMRNDGKLIIMEFSTPLTGYLAPVSRFLLQNFVPTVGGLISGGHKAEYDHLRDSILNFPTPEGFKELVASCGFTDCTNVDLFLDTVHLYMCFKKSVNVSVDSATVERTVTEETQEKMTPEAETSDVHIADTMAA